MNTNNIALEIILLMNLVILCKVNLICVGTVNTKTKTLLKLHSGWVTSVNTTVNRLLSLCFTNATNIRQSGHWFLPSPFVSGSQTSRLNRLYDLSWWSRSKAAVPEEEHVPAFALLQQTAAPFYSPPALSVSARKENITHHGWQIQEYRCRPGALPRLSFHMFRECRISGIVISSCDSLNHLNLSRLGFRDARFFRETSGHYGEKRS